jgi:hypothetical protein
VRYAGAAHLAGSGARVGVELEEATATLVCFDHLRFASSALLPLLSRHIHVPIHVFLRLLAAVVCLGLVPSILLAVNVCCIVRMRQITTAATVATPF